MLVALFSPNHLSFVPRVMVAGVPGVGKSAALASLRPRLTVPVVNFGSTMLEVARASGYIGDRDGLRRASPNDAKKWREIAVHRLPDACIIDGHLVVRRPDSFEVAFPPEMRATGYLEAILVLEASAEQVLLRRAARAREVQDEDAHAIERHLIAARECARGLAAESGVHVSFIDTTRGSASDVADAIAAELPPAFLRP